MKILFVLEYYYPHIGGVEKVFQNLAEGLVRQGHKVDVVTLKVKNSANYEKLNGVDIYRINALNRYLFTFLSIPKVLSLSKKADIIHTTTYNGAFPARVASILTKKKSIITVHEVLGHKWFELGTMNWFNAYIHKILEKLVLSLNFNLFVCVSKSTERDLKRKFPYKKSVVIYNGVDYDFWDPKRYNAKNIRKKYNLNNKFVYLFYGRPGVTKGLEYLLKAVPLISKKIKNSLLFALVSKEDKKRYNFIKSLIKKLKIKDNIILQNPVSYSELPNYLMAADCIVIPSLTEGFGFTTAEACALEKPVVVSNVDSLPEVVSGKYVLVNPKNPKEIAKGVELVYKNKFKSKPKKIFSFEKNIANYLKVYEDVLK